MKPLKAIITVGLGFGDEGKGATVDFLSKDARVVVRYNGGAQALHTVMLKEEGLKHTFSQYGSGTLYGVDTYLAPMMIVDPILLEMERKQLLDIGLNEDRTYLSMHPDCLITTIYHKVLNRLSVITRGILGGSGYNGSCGKGVGEARGYWLKYGLDAPKAGDDEKVLREKLRLMKYRGLERFYNYLSVISAEKGCLERVVKEHLLLPNYSPDIEAARLYEALGYYDKETTLPKIPSNAKSNLVLFEGAQGIMLDENIGTRPHTTWSKTTAEHALDFIHSLRGSKQEIDEFSILGITRTYSTRHGDGYFPDTHGREFSDPNNPENTYQGKMRFAPLDLGLLKYASNIFPGINGLAVNHIDQLDEGNSNLLYPLNGTTYGINTVFNLDSIESQESYDKTSFYVKHPENDPRPSPFVVTKEELLKMVEDNIAPIYVKGNGPYREDREIVGDLKSTKIEYA